MEKKTMISGEGRAVAEAGDIVEIQPDRRAIFKTQESHSNALGTREKEIAEVSG